MKRNTTPGTRSTNGQSTLQVLNQITGGAIGRAMLAAKMGVQYGGERDLYGALGYPQDIDFKEYLMRYLRQDMAQAIIRRPVQATWQGEVNVIETDDDNETPLEKTWRELDKRLGLKSRLERLDKLTGIGQYGVLLLGLSDAGNRDQLAQPVSGGGLKLLYVKPYSQGSADIAQYETQVRNERYGLPRTYTITVSEPGSTGTQQVRVHHTRIIHVVDEVLESETKGRPRLEVVYNRLLDLDKVIGGDAEAFWRNARPGYKGTIKEGYEMGTTEEDELMNQLTEYEHDLRRFLLSRGVDIDSLTQQMADPEKHVDVIIQVISAVTGIPKRILTGSERGELASSEDRGEWLTYVHARRAEYAEPRIVRPLVDRLIAYGVLPEAREEYHVQWEELFSISQKEKAEIAKSWAEALSKYGNTPGAEGIIPPEAFLQYVMQLDKEQIQMITEMRDVYLQEIQQEQATAEEERIAHQQQDEGQQQ